MNDPPPAKRLKQSTIFEALKKQTSDKEQADAGKKDQASDNNMSRCSNRQRTTGQDHTLTNRDVNTSVPEKQTRQGTDGNSSVPGCSKEEPAGLANDEVMSQGSTTSSTHTDIIDSPLLFSDSDLEYPPDGASSSDKPTLVMSMGTPLSEMKTSPSCLPPLGPLSTTHCHTVLIKTPYTAGDVCNPPCRTYKDKWDADHVKLPCSSQNLYPVQSKGAMSLNSRWEFIETTLLSDMSSSLDIEEAILKYNTRYTQKWNFQGLHSFFTEVLEKEEVNEFFSKTLPKMVDLALQLPELCTMPIPLLKKTMNHSITLSQKQVACLLANAFFCTFPRRNTTKKPSEYSTYPEINFTRLFQGFKHSKGQSKTGKIKCLLNYFKQVVNKMPNGTMTFKRQCLTDLPNWNESYATLSRLHVAASGTIEDDGQGMLQVDFANKYLGGGVLGRGCVQEEIRFLICPELILSQLFTEELDHNECLVMTGFETYSNYSGYAASFQWVNNHVDTTPRDSWGRRCTEIVAIDALVFKSYNEQFQERLVNRELNKVPEYLCDILPTRPPSRALRPPSVSPVHLSAVATGNWGCGAFGGDLRLKALIQLMAASQAQRDISYFTFQDYDLMEELYKLHTFLSEKNLVVCDLYQLTMQYYENICKHSSSSRKPCIDLFDYIYSVYIDYGAETDSTNSTDNENPEESGTEAKSIGKLEDSPDYTAETP